MSALDVKRVGICGYATSGKDVVADFLVQRYGFVKVNMSDAVDKYLRILNPMIPIVDGNVIRVVRYDDLRQEMGFTEAKQIIEVRQLLQRLGTDVGRAIDPSMWVKELNKEAAKHDRVVTTGIRFDEEVEPLDLLIHVDRPGVGPVNNHVSDSIEHIIRRADLDLINGSTIEALQEQVAYIFDSIFSTTKGKS